jgi:hypothetical protein
MPNTKPVGVAFSDPELTAGTTIASDLRVELNLPAGFDISQQGATIATTGNSDVFVVIPAAGRLVGVDFSGVDALAANNTNYITFSITNLGTGGSGSAAMLAATAANTTQVTGGSATVANARRALTLTGTAADLVVAAGQRLRIRAAATGTLANTITFPVYSLRFSVL